MSWETYLYEFEKASLVF